MENGPETTSQAPTTASSTDEVMVSDVSAAETVANDAVAVVVDAETPLDAAADAVVSGTETVFSDDETVDIVAERVTEPEDLPDTEAREFQEAPAPQPVHMFDLGDDLGVHPEAPAFDMAEETVEPIVSHEVADEPVVNAQSDDDEAEATIALETTQEPISIAPRNNFAVSVALHQLRHLGTAEATSIRCQQASALLSGRDQVGKHPQGHRSPVLHRPWM